MNAIQKLRELVGEVRKGPASAMHAWPVAERLLARMPIDQAEVKRVCSARDEVGLDALVSRLEAPAQGQTPASASAAFSEDDLKAALKAFNKRLKLARLSDESRLGNRYTSGGRKSQIDAILPPEDFPPEIWRALAAAGRLKYTGEGFYAPA